MFVGGAVESGMGREVIVIMKCSRQLVDRLHKKVRTQRIIFSSSSFEFGF
jgi:hypothetical protein